MNPTRRRFLGLLGASAGVAAVAPLVAGAAGLMVEHPPRLWADGVHDDTAAIQWRLDRLKNVTLEGGFYRTEGVLVLGSGCTIAGCHITHNGPNGISVRA